MVVNRIRTKKQVDAERKKALEMKRVSPIERAKHEMLAVFKHAEKYRIGILKNVATFGTLIV